MDDLAGILGWIALHWVYSCREYSANYSEESALSLPEAWLVIAVYPDGTRKLERAFPSRREAEEYASHQTDKIYMRSFIVERDSPDLDVQIEGIHQIRPYEITIRENWVKRNVVSVSALKPPSKSAFVYTMELQRNYMMSSTRILGLDVLSKGTSVSKCSECKEPMSFVGFLNTTPIPEAQRSRVGISCFACLPCRETTGLMSGRAYWIHTNDLEDQKPALAEEAKEAFVGTKLWEVQDFDIETTGIDGNTAEEERRLGRYPRLLATVTGTKVGGFPTLTQDLPFPSCPVHGQMRFVGQLIPSEESELHSNYIIFLLFACQKPDCEEVEVELEPW